jgi:flagellar motor switch protein FliG
VTAAVPQSESISAVRKAAILMIVLGEEAGAEMMRRLPPTEVRKLSEEIARLGVVGGDQTETVLREFYHMAAAFRIASHGGPAFAQKLLSKALGAEEAAKLIAHLTPANGDLTGIESLQRSDPQQLARFLQSEHPQTIALILSHLVPAQAAALLASLTPVVRTDVAVRMASLDQIAPEVVGQVATVISEKLRSVASLNREAYGGVRALAELCNRLDSETSKEILAGMDSANSALAESIRNLMFVFDDILGLDDAAMNEITGRVDRKTLVMALKGTNDQIKQHFTKKMSSRAREMLLEDLDALGPVKIKEVEAAQQQVISTIRQLEQQGVLSLRGSAGEQYVV